MLRIRKKSHHAKCSQCVRHRLIIRKLGHCLPARRAQVAELQKHLARQYGDRQIYWANRSLSRVSASSASPNVITAIIDSMDAAKHACPKSQNMFAKEFSSWAKPRLSSTTLLIHGFAAVTVLSPHFVTCSSSRSAEIISHGLSLLVESGYDLRASHLMLQGDNASKELKNACMLHWASCQVATKRAQRCTLSFLSSGHSHEDIDALFSVMASWLERERELHTPAAFVSALKRFMDAKEHRPNEPLKRVVLMTKYRDWTLCPAWNIKVKLYIHVFFWVSWLTFPQVHN